MKIRIVAKTDTGKERDNNEDAFTFCPDLCSPNWNNNAIESHIGQKGSVLVVADGMGGANAGEVASNLTIESIQKTFNSSNFSQIIASEEKITAFLKNVITTADRYLNEHMISHPETIGMGTTIVICWILKDKAFIAWCGDSRC